MEGQSEITAEELQPGDTIRHPATNRWVKADRVKFGETGIRRRPPAASEVDTDVYVTLEGGEVLTLDAPFKLVRRD